jgi:phosphoglucan,water dikinase
VTRRRAWLFLTRIRGLFHTHATTQAALTEGYGGVPVALGAAFSVPPRVSASFVDATVRASVPYQLSRLLTPMLRAAAARCDSGEDGGGGAASSSKSSIVVGRGVGRLVECARLEPGAAGKARDGPVVAFVWRAEGDEVGGCPR